jgi:hypothetical protein
VDVERPGATLGATGTNDFSALENMIFTDEKNAYSA